MSLRPGSLVADYRILRKLGEGGMGEVYLAAHQTLGQQVVLKGLHRELTRDKELQGRFAREAEAMARLRHPNIVAIYNFLQQPDGTAFIVMEFVEGVTFDDLVMKLGLIPPDRAIQLIVPVLKALEYAHRHGVIHRDLKPANFMLGYDEVARILDFGTAKLVDKPGLTRAGTTLGTANYMSPEQVMGRDLTPAADIYSIGATMYEMCTGRLPFEAEDTSKLVRSIFSEAPVPPSVYYPAIPKALEEAILKCLAKRPEERYQSANELADVLEGIAAKLAAPVGYAAAAPVAVAPAAPSPAPAPLAPVAPEVAAKAARTTTEVAAPPDFDANDRAVLRSELAGVFLAMALGGAGAVGVAGGGYLLMVGQSIEGSRALAAAWALWVLGTLLAARRALFLLELARRPAPPPLVIAAAPAPAAAAPAPAPAAPAVVARTEILQQAPGAGLGMAQAPVLAPPPAAPPAYAPGAYAPGAYAPQGYGQPGFAGGGVAAHLLGRTPPASFAGRSPSGLTPAARTQAWRYALLDHRSLQAAASAGSGPSGTPAIGTPRSSLAPPPGQAVINGAVPGESSDVGSQAGAFALPTDQRRAAMKTIVASTEDVHRAITGSSSAKG